MVEVGSLLYYSGIAFTVCFTAFGVGLGGGFIGVTALSAINIAPTAQSEIQKATIIGLALLETGGILATFMALLLILGGIPEPTHMVYLALGEWGIALALGITGFIVGLTSALPVQAAILSIARQPFFSTKIINIMLLTQSLIQTPVIFAFLVALLIYTQLPSLDTLANGVRLLASGLCIGVGSIGPIIGLSRFAKAACQGVGINRNAYGKLLPFIFMSQAIIETPIIFALLIAMIIISSPITAAHGSSRIIAILAAAACTAFGTLSPGISSGRIAVSAANQIALKPEQYSLLSRASIIGQGLIDAAAIYALLVSMLILLL